MYNGHEKLEVVGDYVYHYKYDKPLLKKKVKRFKGVRYKRNIYFSYKNAVQKKKKFYQILQCNLKVNSDVPYFLTLTFIEQLEIDRCWVIFKRFIQRIKRKLKLDQSFKYIVVLEFQKRGVVHFHLLVWGLNNYLKNERKNRIIQMFWTRGFVDSIKTDGNIKLAGYFTKYLFKGLQDQRIYNRRLYNTSRNIVRPVLLNTQTQVAFGSEVLELEQAKNLGVVKYSTRWLGDCLLTTYQQN